MIAKKKKKEKLKFWSKSSSFHYNNVEMSTIRSEFWMLTMGKYTIKRCYYWDVCFFVMKYHVLVDLHALFNHDMIMKTTIISQHVIVNQSWFVNFLWLFKFMYRLVNWLLLRENVAIAGNAISIERSTGNNIIARRDR